MMLGASGDPVRLALLAGLTLAYAGACLAPCLRLRRQRRAARLAAAAALATPDAGNPSWIVAHASQTGGAEELAGQTVRTLRLAGVDARLCPLSGLDGAALRGAERILFLVSTYGEGDAPDAAATFLARVMGAPLPLPQLHYAMLALGDRAYSHFCAFGRVLDEWLAAQGAARLFARIEVDCGAAPALDEWRRQLSHLAGTSDAPDWGAPAFADWRLAARRLLNPGSAGAPVYHLELAPQDGILPHWESGDLAQIAAPAEPGRPREYSIASVPADGRVHLLVRQQARADGGAGLASGWLTAQAGIGAAIALRLRPHRRFRLERNADGPLILIGNGSGIAGLRGHLKSRILAEQRRNWLIFGERNGAHDFHYRAEIEAWRDGGALARLDLAFSRDQAQRVYVQDRLLGNADELRMWLGEGAAIYVCGSLNGMAGGVDLALEEIVGRAALDGLAAQGRYRRDVY